MPDNGSSTGLDATRDVLLSLHDEQGMTWDEIAAMPRFSGIPKGTLWNIAHGHVPKDNELRRRLGLPLICPRCEFEFQAPEEPTVLVPAAVS